MRIFVAIEFDKEITQAINQLVSQLRPHCTGHFTKTENLHLTLKFLGEVRADRLQVVKAAMDAGCAGQEPFTLGLARPGSFKSGDGESIVWLGLTHSAELARLVEALDQSLAAVGFAAETRPFRAHITLARRAVCDAAIFSEVAVPDVCYTVRTVTLFESTRIGSSLIYRPLYRAELKK